MIHRAALAVALALATTGAVLATTTPSLAQPLATAVTPADDVRRTILVGPSGQVWEPDGQGGWTRTAGGGVAADVRGALLVDGLVIAGKATPFYRRNGDAWYGLRLGERGKTLAGTGARASLAIGRHVFVWNKGSWMRIGAADRAIVAVWAASERRVFVATDRAVLRLAGKKLVTHQPIAALAFAGPTPFALTAEGVVHDVAARSALAPTLDGRPVVAERVAASPDGAPWILGRAGTDRVLVRRLRRGWEGRPPPPLAPDDTVVHLAVDGAARAVLVTGAGKVLLAADDGTWTHGTLTTSLAAARPGPGPARMP